MNKRLLLKFSGEQLAGQHGFGIDPEVVHYVAKECAKVVEAGCQLVIVAGGGNMVRGAKVAGHGIKRVTADQMGMLSGLINAMGMTDIFESEGVPTRCMSNVYAEQLAESYSFRLAEKHLERGRVVVIAGGMARPYFTHDTAAVSFALELSCDAALKASKVDGVYDKDPNSFPDAKRLEQLTFQQAIENSDIQVMDKAALGLAMEQHMPIIVFDAMQPDNLVRLARGESVGTKIA
ncbi:MAG TPA: UMP kinase [Candidatus Saccharimonadales bacterium]|nr:UMP kinase [Candidatus Saccharimonadales bacterium]